MAELTERIFEPGKITTVLDGGAGSSAKSLRAAYAWKNFKQEHTTCAVNTFMENAAHTITYEDGTEYIHQCLSGVTTLHNYEAQYLGPGCVFQPDTFKNEIKRCNADNIFVHPNAVMVSDIDIAYEKGQCDFEGNLKSDADSANLRIGSTLHGVGAARARRVLRRKEVKLARDTDLPTYHTNQILKRLNDGESMLGEIAQGYQLSLMSSFYPKVTSRNCTVAAFLDDMMLPPTVLGPVVINFRTFPIRVNSNKYIRISDNKILTWTEWNDTPENDRRLIKGDSGAWYGDQQELTWDDISVRCGEKVFECTSLTKLPRRVATFSTENMLEAIVHNNTGSRVYLSVNFMNYVDAVVKGKRVNDEVITDKVHAWLLEKVFNEQLHSVIADYDINIGGLFIGTWKTIDDSVFIDRQELYGRGLLHG